jgi:hypothetical protein
MEFWGVEVPAGKPTSCHPGDGMYLHVSQAALGESKDKSGKGSARVVLKVQVDDSEVILGTLSEGKCDQMPLDLVFDREFTVSHNSGSSSVYICGYRTEGPEYDDSEEEEEDEEDEDMPVAVPIESNGAAAGKQIKALKVEEAAKKAVAAVKDQKKAVKKQVVESSDSEDDEGLGHPFVSDLASESDDEFDAGDDSDEDMDDDDDEDDDEDDEDDDEDGLDESEEEELKIEAPKPAGKKRAAEALTKSAEKKSKTDASAKPGQSPGKKGAKGAPVTPVGKAAAPAEVKTPTDKGSKPAKAPKGTPTAPPTTPVSEKKIGQHKCTGCDRTFVTESAMSQHAAAKHKA